MNSIVIGFSHPTKFSLHAWIIEKVDNASFDHAYLRFHSDSLNRDIVYQSNWRGVEFIGSTLWQTTATPVEEYTIAVDDTEYTSMMQFCVDNCGVSYGYLATIGAGLVKLGICKTNPFSSGLKTEFCSEIVARCLNVVDPAQFQLDAANITPNDLNQLLKKLNIARIF
jgi:hypothetical protein